jgi:hypothetical protein
MAPMKSVLILFQVGRVNKGAKAAKTDIVSGVIVEQLRKNLYPHIYNGIVPHAQPLALVNLFMIDRCFRIYVFNLINHDII